TVRDWFDPRVSARTASAPRRACHYRGAGAMAELRQRAPIEFQLGGVGPAVEHHRRLFVTVPGFVDVHAHFVTDSYIAQARAAGHEEPDGMPFWPTWSAEAHLELMDRCGIDTALLSLSSPGVHFGDDSAACDLARQVNEDGARVVRDHPGRFGLFAS